MQFVFPPILETGQEDSEGFHQELLRGITHKLNNQLAVIQGFGSLIMMTENLDPVIQENMQHIKQASQGVAQLSDRIRAAGGCAKISTQPTAIGSYLGMVEGSLREPFNQAGLAFEMEIHPALPKVQVDASKLKEVLMEILRNAAEACQESKGVTMLKLFPPGVITPESERRVDILISNTGSQIPETKQADVFKPFSGSKPSQLGLGWTIAQMLCSQMKIQIGLASENNSTTFWLSCPVAPEG
jgi:signal transduction histidine kinase